MIATHPLGWLWLVGIYLLRPLLLLPMTILTVFTGFLFGLGWGLAYALTATLASASLAYLLARFLRVGRFPPRGHSLPRQPAVEGVRDGARRQTGVGAR